MKIRNFVLIILYSLCLSSSIFTHPLNDVSIGTRPGSMGHAFTGVSDDANAPYYNSAGTAYLTRSQLTFQNIFFKNSLNSFNFISFSHVMGKFGSVSFSGIKSSFEEKYGQLNYLSGGYANRLFWFLTAGVNLKYCNQINDPNSSNQVDADFSLYLDPTLSKKKEIQNLMYKIEKFISKKSETSFELGKEAFHKKKYVEAISLFQESLNYDPNNKEVRDYLMKCKKITGLKISLPPIVEIKSEPLKGDFTMQEREILAEKAYQEGLEHYYNENYILALKSWQKALDTLYINYTVDRMKIGVSVKNVLRHKYYDETDLKRRPVQLNLGLTYTVIRDLRILTEFYKQEGEGKNLGVNLGLEIDPLDFLTLRGGMQFAQPITFENKANKFTAGLGLFYKDYSLDYGFEPNNQFYNHTLSLSIKFGMSQEERALNMLNEGVVLSKSGKTRDAEAKWKEALLLDPSLLMARKYLKGEVGTTTTLSKKTKEELSNEVMEKGVAFFKKKDYLQARIHFSEALVINNENDKARTHLEQTKEIINNLITDLFIKGNDSLSKGDWESAVDSFNKILEYDFQNQQAKDLLKEAKNKFRTQIDAYKDKAKKNYKDKKYKSALENIDQFLKYEKEDEEARELKFQIDQAIVKENQIKDCNKLFTKGNTFFSNRQYKKAREMYLQVKKNCPDYEANKGRIKLVNQKIEQEKEIKEKQKEARIFFQDGLKEYKKGNYKEAHSLFKQALSLDPKLTKADFYVKESDNKILQNMEQEEKRQKAKELYEESLVLLKKEKYSDALNKLNKAQSLDNRNELIRRKIVEVKDTIRIKVDKPYQDGIKYYNERRLSKAIQQWEYVLKIQPDHTLAKAYLAKANKQKKQSIKIHNKLGQKYLKRKKYISALKEFREVLALDPENTIAKQGAEEASEVLADRINGFYKKGETYFNDNKFNKAKREFQNALNIDPGHVPSQEYLKRCDEKIYKLTKQGKVNIHMNKGKEYYKNRFFQEAVKEFEKVLLVDPAHVEAKRLLGDSKKKIKEMKNKDQVSELFNDVAKYYRDEDYKNALKLLKKINKIDPNNELIKRYITVTGIKWNNYCDEYYNKAKNMEKEGDFVSAKNFYQKVYRSKPQYKDIKMIMDRFNSRIKDYIKFSRQQARKLYNEKKYGESYILWDRISKLKPKDQEARKYARITGSKSGKIIQAQRYYKKGKDLFAQKKYIDSAVQFNKALNLNPAFKNEYNKKYKNRIYISLKKDLDSILNQGIKSFDNEEYVKAMEYMELVYQISPENQRAKKYYFSTKTRIKELSKRYFSSAQRNADNKKYNQAFKNIKLALKYAPANEEIRDYHQELNTKYGKTRKIKQRKSKGNVDALLFEGIRLYRAGELKKAIAKWKQARRIDPGNDKINNYISRAETKLKKLGGK